MPARHTDLLDFDTVLNGTGPIAVAVSGGGDSVALLYALVQWGQRPLHVLHVDHGLQANSGLWAQSVSDHAQRLGVNCTVLKWEDDKPEHGLSAAARSERHRLLAQAARALGLKVICMAHTADDIAEAAVMRAAGSSVGTPVTWSPSPVWPQGRGVFLCRPWLNRTRAELRDWLRSQGITWIDDPANDAYDGLRASARRHLRTTPLPPIPTVETRIPRDQIKALLHDPEGWSDLGLLRLSAEGVRDLPHAQALRLLATAAVCAGGGDRLPPHHSVARLMDILPEGGAHTLVGARIQQVEGLIHVVREHGDIGRTSARTLCDGVWDGRFALPASVERDIVAARGVRRRLSRADQAWLNTLPAALRGTLPVIVPDGIDRGPYLARPDRRDAAAATGLVQPRCLASACVLNRETDL